MTAPVRDDAQGHSAVGATWPRLDSREKVVGSTRYVDGMPKLGSVTVHVDPSDQEGLDPHADLAHHDQALLETHRRG